MVQFSFQGAETLNANGTTGLGSISSTYAPKEILTVPVHRDLHNILLLLETDGAITVHNASNTTSVNMRVLVTYALKSKLGSS